MVLGWEPLAAASFWFFPFCEVAGLAAGLDEFVWVLLGAPCDRAKAERIKVMRKVFERVVMRARVAV
jgi:hypothetical protein